MSYRKDIEAAWAHVRSIHSRKLETTSGTVEYAVEGVGPPVLMSHGILGCHTEGIGMVRSYFGTDCMAISPSRFGYFDSTMPVGATPALQADCFERLLDHLEVDRTVVIGYSAGAPSAMEFALRHPDRTVGLALASSALPPSVRPPGFMAPILRTITRTELFFWLFKTYMPRRLWGLMGVPDGYVPTSDEQVTIRAVSESIFPIASRRVGFVFDAFVGNTYSRQIPLEEIDVPTIILHSADDSLAPYQHAVNAADRIPGAEFVTIDKGGHLFLGHEPAVRDAVTGFVARQVEREPALAVGGA